MVDRVILRKGVGLVPPSFMRPNELAYSPSDFQLWIADQLGTPHKAANTTASIPVVTPSGTGGTIADAAGQMLADSFGAHLAISATGTGAVIQSPAGTLLDSSGNRLAIA